MTFPIGTPFDSQASLMDIMQAQGEISRDNKKSLRLSRQLHHEKKMDYLDQNIAALQEHQDQLKQAAGKSFWGGILGNILQAVTLAATMIFPAAAPLINKISDLLQNLIGTIFQKLAAKDQSSAEAAQIESEQMKQKADLETRYESMYEEQIEDEKQSRQLIQNRLEAALQDIHQSKNAAVRV